MAWILDKAALYSVSAIKATAKRKAKVAAKAYRKRTRAQRQADFDDQVQSAIEAGIPVQIVPYVETNHYRKKDVIAALQAEIKELKRNKFEKPPYVKGMGSDFYLTREWRELRWKVLIASDGKCKMCGRSKDDGVIIHIDHIKPRSKYPALELVFDNLQVLCEDCNIGKSNK